MPEGGEGGWTAAERGAFWRDGFVLRSGVIPPEVAHKLRDHYADMFAGRFPTGVYPDEWHWREGVSLPGAMREIVNGWKASHVVAAVSLSPRVGRLASELMGWRGGARVGQDDLLWKPPGAGGVGWHQDSAYISTNFLPLENNSVTVWIALDDADEETGVVSYAAGSHRWPGVRRSATNSAFHGKADPLAPARAAAAAAGAELDVRKVKVPCGSAIFHHQDVWHGSGPNVSASRPRRALGLHLIRADVSLRVRPPPDYIYGRYAVRDGSGEVSDHFFPVTWAPEGHASPIVRRLLRPAAAL